MRSHRISLMSAMAAMAIASAGAVLPEVQAPAPREPTRYGPKVHTVPRVDPVTGKPPTNGAKEVARRLKQMKRDAT